MCLIIELHLLNFCGEETREKESPMSKTRQSVTLLAAMALITLILAACTGTAPSGGSTGGEAELKNLGGGAGETRWGYGCLGSAEQRQVFAAELKSPLDRRDESEIFSN